MAAWPARADQYRGNGDTGFGGAIGNGTLTLTDDGTNISGTLTVVGSMNDVLVLYIQSGPGGFADTSGFNDQGDYRCQAISGVSASGRSLLTFASGFKPNYAIVLGPSAVESGSLWQLANGTNGSLVYLGSANLAPLNDTGPYTFSFPAALIGMIPGVRSTIQVFGTYVRTDGSRSTEAIAGNLTGSPGWNAFTQTAYGSYIFDAGAVLVKLPLGIWAQRADHSPSPIARYAHTAVWTGSEMIVWGGVGYGIRQRRALQPDSQQLGGSVRDRRARLARVSHGGMDWKRNDRLGRVGRQRLLEHRRALRSGGRQLDDTTHDECARRACRPHRSVDG